MLNQQSISSRLQNDLPGRDSSSTQVGQQYSELEKVVLQTENVIVEVEKRLNPVLRAVHQPPVTGPGKCADAEEYLVPLADALRNTLKAAVRQQNQLISILERLEV